MRRRDFFAVALAGPPTLRLLQAYPAGPVEDNVSRILARIRPPTFPDRTFDILQYGATPDGSADSRPGIAGAIAECHAAGGGKVVVPAGVYVTNGPVHLASNVNLHLAEGSRILFGFNPDDYLPAVLTRWEGVRCYNYSPLIYARGQENIAITGSGVLDGQTKLFWSAWKQKQTGDQEALRNLGARREPLAARGNSEMGGPKHVTSEMF